MKQEERKYKNVKTSEILDFVAKDIPYDKDKERDKQNDYKEELEQREPFGDIKRKIDNMVKNIRDLTDVMNKMMKHTHSKDGKVTIPVEQAIGTDRLY